MEKYGYLKKYINFNNFDGKRPYNWFEAISLQEIIEAEKKIGFRFPESLKEFWWKIGRGSLPNPSNLDDDFIATHFNHILRPSDIASIILEEEDAPILPFVREYFQEGDIPFFEIGDSSNFLLMKRDSKYPDMVYDMSGEKIDHFERFIWRLYHESPTYYLYV